MDFTTSFLVSFSAN
jgi:hypothetical protein